MLSQKSACFIACVYAATALPQYTQNEINDGIEIVWHDTFNDVIACAEKDEPVSEAEHLTSYRDFLFMRAAQRTYDTL